MYKILPLLFIVVAACSSSHNTTENTTGEQRTASDKQKAFYCDDIRELKNIEDESLYASTSILKYKVIEGCVCIKYQYSGCGEGEPQLIWNGEYSREDRPEVMMKLMVKDAGLCEQLLTDSSCFSMKRMQLIGNQVLVYLNSTDNDFLLNYEDVGPNTD